MSAKTSYTVGKEKDCNFKTIQSALDACEENAEIIVMPGLYEEQLKFTKPVKLTGCKESIFDKVSKDLPVIVLDKEQTLELDIPVKLEGLVFTHDTNLEFQDVTEVEELNTDNDYLDNDEDIDSDDFRTALLIQNTVEINNCAFVSCFGWNITFSSGNSKLENIFANSLICANDDSPKFNNSKIEDFKSIYKTKPAFTGCELLHDFISYNESKPIFTGCKFLRYIEIECDSTPSFIESTLNGYFFYIRDKSSPSFEKCKIYGYTGDEENEFVIDDSSTPKFSNCEIYDMPDSCIEINGSAEPIFTNCEFHDIGTRDYYYSINIYNKASPSFNNCDFHDNEPESIICIDDDAKGSFNNCNIHDNSFSSGVIIKGHASPVFYGCEIFDNNLGICSVDDNKAVFEDCSIHDNCNACDEDECDWVDALYAYDQAQRSLDDYTFAVVVFDNSKPIFRNCKIFNNHLDGIVVSADSHSLPTIDNCQIYENRYAGIKVFGKGLGIISNCEIYKNGSYGISMNGYEGVNVFITSCNIHDNSNSGLITHGEGANPSVFKTAVNDNRTSENEYNVCIDEDFYSTYDLYLKDLSAYISEGGKCILIGENKEDTFLNYDNYGIQTNPKKSILIPKTVKKLRQYALTGCIGLEKIEVEDGNESYAAKDGVLYSKDFTELIACPYELQGELTVPDSVKVIASFAFAGCQKLTKINLPVGLLIIYYGAFMYCTALTSVKIPDSVVGISYGAFVGCSSLKTINLPNNTEIEKGAFDNNTEVIGGKIASDDDDDAED